MDTLCTLEPMHINENDVGFVKFILTMSVSCLQHAHREGMSTYLFIIIKNCHTDIGVGT